MNYKTKCSQLDLSKFYHTCFPIERITEIYFFKPCGKFYAQKTLDFTDEEFLMADPVDCVKSSLKRNINKGSFEGVRVFCIFPFHTNSHPVTFILKWKGKEIV